MNFDKYVAGADLLLHTKNVNIRKLTGFLQGRQSIEGLSIASCNINDEDVKELAKSEHLKNLTFLGLGWNKIGDEGLRALSDAVKSGRLPKA